MRRLSVKGLSAMTALGLVVFPGAAVAQQKTLKEQLIGTWLLVSIETMAKDGTKVSLFGANSMRAGVTRKYKSVLIVQDSNQAAV